MNGNYPSPTPCFWNFTGFGIAVLSLGVSWSLLSSSNYKLEALNSKLEVNTAVERVKKVSDTLAESAKQLPTVEKEKIQKQLKEAEEKLSQTQKEILSDEDSQQNSQGEI